MPPAKKQFNPRPSPLATVSNVRPISFDPTLGLVRDPQFWKRFSTAVHNEEASKKDVEEIDLEKGAAAGGVESEKGSSITGSAKDSAGSGSSRGGRSGSDGSQGSDWLLKQNQKKRAARNTCITIMVCMLVIVLVGVLLGLHFMGKF